MSRSRLLSVLATATVLGVVAWGADRLILGDGLFGPASSVETNDAYVTADFTLVAPKVAGRIDRVIAQDNERVRKGEELAHIEDDDYRASLMVAQGKTGAARADVDNLLAALERQKAVIAGTQANVQADEAALTFAQQNSRRYQTLSIGGAATTEQQQSAATQRRTAQATLVRDQASVKAAEREMGIITAQLARARSVLMRTEGEEKQAELDLSYCTIPAPFSGVVGARGVRVGAYVMRGTALMAVVPVQEAYVLANFQETQLTHVLPGQKALIWIDTFPDHPLHAHVDSIPPATGVAFAPIQPDNATGNFTKVVQRLPVKLVFDAGQPLTKRVRVGMSAEVRIDTSSRPEGSHAEDTRYGWN
ncbi:HlyD family secretion protein [Oecophyllibacter saccharovorans]|uniref:HlyD family secretion protein n=1 Tax=Oecophyllibacter saccharovorans TaxID=2558360 RepID=UPI00114135A5|nr:HlyD family secretion protein [Oecophyllibacter saccharovorans]QDH15812.1 HlyD family secretion protein [Oecophyllibacter saccharovorans]